MSKQQIAMVARQPCVVDGHPRTCGEVFETSGVQALKLKYRRLAEFADHAVRTERDKHRYRRRDMQAEP